ncbi:hypothetical protein OAG32_03960, partial [Akkermansiaceae bacterium]|nr:hypothetical protein [Akkermansiaceae bacterium]
METGAKGELSKNQGTGYGVRCLPLTKDSPLPFPDSGMLLFGSVVHESSDTKLATGTHERVSRVV